MIELNNIGKGFISSKNKVFGAMLLEARNAMDGFKDGNNRGHDPAGRYETVLEAIRDNVNNKSIDKPANITNAELVAYLCVVAYEIDLTNSNTLHRLLRHLAGMVPSESRGDCNPDFVPESLALVELHGIAVKSSVGKFQSGMGHLSEREARRELLKVNIGDHCEREECFANMPDSRLQEMAFGALIADEKYSDWFRNAGNYNRLFF